MYACAILLLCNEIALERYYKAASLLASYLKIKFSIKIKLMVMIVFAVGLYAMIHGIYKIKVVFAQNFEVYADHTIKFSLALKLLYLASLILAAYEFVGYSNEA